MGNFALNPFGDSGMFLSYFCSYDVKLALSRLQDDFLSATEVSCDGLEGKWFASCVKAEAHDRAFLYCFL